MHLWGGVLRFPALAPVIVLRSPGWLRLIAAFKLVKAVLCIAVALGALQMLRPELAVRAQQTMEAVAMHIDRRWAGHLIDWMSRQPLNRFQVIAIVAFLYAALFLTEGAGLWKEKRWAEYLTVIATISFVPFEIYEIIHRQSAPRIAALVLNLVVVAYLIYRLRHSDARSVAAHF